MIYRTLFILMDREGIIECLPRLLACFVRERRIKRHFLPSGFLLVNVSEGAIYYVQNSWLTNDVIHGGEAGNFHLG